MPADALTIGAMYASVRKPVELLVVNILHGDDDGDDIREFKIN